jgi:hypothetical protein
MEKSMTLGYKSRLEFLFFWLLKKKAADAAFFYFGKFYFDLKFCK